MKTHESDPSQRVHKPSVVQRLGLGAFSISLLVHGLFALVAVLFLYKWVYPPGAPDGPATFVPPGKPPGGETTAKIKTSVQKTVPVSNHDKGIIAIPGISDYALPKSETNMGSSAIPSSMSTPGGGNAPGIPGSPGGPGGNKAGRGIDPGNGGGFMTPFGNNVAVDGSMPGHFYDFKQNAKGKAVEGYNVQGPEFTNNVIKIQEEGFRENAFRKFFKAPDSLYLTQLAIPTTDADAGPRFFNVADKVKPSGWLVVYDGSISTTRDMTFRFVGIGDDYISVFNNRRPKLINAWPDMRQSVLDRWKPSEPIDNDAPSPMAGSQLVKGDWITLKRGEKFSISIAIGERPGGKVGFVLMVEEKDAQYRTATNGSKVLPLFTTQTITKTARDRITSDFKNWEFEWENVPVFAVDRASGMGAEFR